ncbi:MAG: TonB-dependent receptor, partial [Opitutaceae bacterium]|nr:TonB-dependent receptor [Opitutaceae bacterium]
VPPAFIQDRRDVRAHGYELEIVANLSKALRVSANFALARTEATNASDLTAAWVDRNLPALRQIVLDAGARLDAANVASIDPAVPVDRRPPDLNTTINSWNSMIAARANIVEAAQLLQRTSSGNLYADYTFAAGRLRGLRVGAGARYRGPIIIGYRGADTMVNPANPAAAIDDPRVDGFTPVYAAGYTVATATLGYTWRGLRNQPVVFTLRVDNLLDEKKPHYINTLQRPPGGDVTNPARIATPRDLWWSVPRGFTLTAKLAY